MQERAQDQPRRFVDPEVETSMCLMAEGPPGFEAAFAAALPEMLLLLIVLDYTARLCPTMRSRAAGGGREGRWQGQ